MKPSRRVVLACLACLAATAPALPASAQGTGLTHPNGLSITAPEGFATDSTADGFILQEAGARRTPLRIEVELVPDPPGLQVTSSAHLADGTPVYTHADTHEGGSGGPEHVMIWWKPVPDAWIVVRASQQSELGEPDFTRAWEIFRKARAAG